MGKLSGSGRPVDYTSKVAQRCDSATCSSLSNRNVNADLGDPLRQATMFLGMTMMSSLDRYKAQLDYDAKKFCEKFSVVGKNASQARCGSISPEFKFLLGVCISLETF